MKSENIDTNQQTITVPEEPKLSWPEKALAAQQDGTPPEPVTAPVVPIVPPQKNRAGRTLLVLAILLVVGVAGGQWWKQELERRWKWEAIPMPEKMARVTAEWGPSTLASRLKNSGKIRDEATFIEAARQVKMTTALPGGYWLPEKAGPLELAQIFSKPPPLIKVTFPEGWTAERMANRLQAEKFAAASEFKQLAYPSNTVVSPLEGKLFPDTYYLPHAAKADELATRLKNRYREIMASVPQPYPEGYNKKRLSADEVTTLASLVERETDVASERPMIAGVLLNRLRIRMRLQCDASVQYARQRAAAMGQVKVGHKARLMFRDIDEVEKSPYNTYKVYGLPPGPICNPGAESLKAAARPKSSEYLFYVMSPKLGRHRFAKTFEEHKHNIRLAKTEQ